MTKSILLYLSEEGELKVLLTLRLIKTAYKIFYTPN